MATGEGCDHRHNAFVHFRPNLHNVGDCGRSGGTNPVRPPDTAAGADAATDGVGATTGAGAEAGATADSAGAEVEAVGASKDGPETSTGFEM